MAESGTAGGDAGVALGKGAWDCVTRSEIPPEKEAVVFEEIATTDHVFEGIPTVPLRKDREHMAAYCGACRYRVAATPDMTVEQVKRALWDGGIQHKVNESGRPATSRTTSLRDWSDLALLYAMQVMQDNRTLAEYGVPPGCKVLIAVEAAALGRQPDSGSPYWN